MVLWPTTQRMCELWYIHSNQRELSEDEWTEFKHCLDAHVGKCWKLARLYNFSLMASMSNDNAWQMDIAKEIDQIKDELYDYM